MSDYNFMKSGSGDDKRNLTDEQIKDIQSLIMLFAENSFKLAAEYVKHANRTIIQAQDLKNCLKVESMLFCQKDNTLQEARLLVDEINQELDEDDEDDELGDIITDEHEDFCLSTCTCPLCIIDKYK